MNKSQTVRRAGSVIRPGSLLSIILLAFTGSLSSQVFPDHAVTQLKAPEIFRATFETTKGTFVVEAIREWAPAGVDRLYQLLQTHFYDSNCLFRVQKGYVVQFGISDHQAINRFWEDRPIPDEPVKQSNLTGVISYARDGPGTRTVQLFINLGENAKLDTINFNGLCGFPPVARIISGFGVVEQFHSEYGFEPANHQDSLLKYGNRYQVEHFPGLDYILRARISEVSDR